MKPYVSNSRKVWLCPTILSFQPPEERQKPQIHYIPTSFDANPQTPFRWPKHPWLIESADAHGKGPLILFTDGSIVPLQTHLNSINQN